LSAIPKELAPGALSGVLAEFDRCWPWLEAALRHGGDRHTKESIWAGIVRGQYQFWPYGRSAGITHVDVYPTCSVLQLWLVGGELDDVLAHEPELAAWAKAVGCAAMQLVGRPGWAKALRALGYGRGDVILTRGLDDGPVRGDGGFGPE
jgi:hypothetical protein